MTPCRIGYVVGVFPKLSETFIANEIAELCRRGLEVRILSLRTPAEELRHEIVKQTGLAERTVYDAKRFPAVLREFKPDLLHAHFATKATAVARELAAEFKIPFTFTAHRYDIYDRPPADFAERASAAVAVITVSDANRNYIVKNFGVPPEKISVIPCGVDTAMFQPNGERLQPPHIVCVARMAAVKNQGLLLEACARLRADGLNFRCVLVGDGPCRDDLADLREQLALTDFVQMVGAAEQGEVLAWWQRATIGVLTSSSEGMPVSLMEAGACGVPTVATAVGGVPELIENGVTGFVIPTGDASALAHALKRLLMDPVLAMKLGEAARRRVREWFSLGQQADRLLALWSAVTEPGADRGPQAGSPLGVVDATGSARAPHSLTAPVTDPFGVAADPEMPYLARAIDPAEVQRQFRHCLPRLDGADGDVHLRTIRVTRYKPARRCVIEYELEVERSDAPPERVVLIGKIRARHRAKTGYGLLASLWNAGFSSDSADGIAVPEPIGIVPDFSMWLQRKVTGRVATDLLAGPGGPALGRRIAEAACKLHHAGVCPKRRHTMADELRILRQRLPGVVPADSIRPERIERLLHACHRLGSTIVENRRCGIHRDFYPEQVIVDGERLYLVDFDLYCEGDPSLDIGNFLGHITEQSLRTLGDAAALAHVEKAIEDRFVETSGEAARPSVRAYATLTLARHVYLSTLFPARRPFTMKLLELCEERIGIQQSIKGKAAKV